MSIFYYAKWRAINWVNWKTFSPFFVRSSLVLALSCGNEREKFRTEEKLSTENVFHRMTRFERATTSPFVATGTVRVKLRSAIIEARDTLPQICGNNLFHMRWIQYEFQSSLCVPSCHARGEKFNLPQHSIFYISYENIKDRRLMKLFCGVTKVSPPWLIMPTETFL